LSTIHLCIAGFNPLPAFRPGETEQAAAQGTLLEVSIRSRLFGREKPAAKGVLAGNIRVSIRSRLFGREKRLTEAHGRSKPRSFNPLPAFRPGETQAAMGIAL